jgi:hypothetical protein
LKNAIIERREKKTKREGREESKRREGGSEGFWTFYSEGVA